MIREFYKNDAEAILAIDASELDNLYRIEALTYSFNEARWVFDLNNKVIGYLFVNLYTCEITQFAFEAGQQGKGYGTRLFQHVNDWLKENGKIGAFVSVNSANEGARRFYERNGFVRIADLPMYFQGEDALHMAKRL